MAGDGRVAGVTTTELAQQAGIVRERGIVVVDGSRTRDGNKGFGLAWRSLRLRSDAT